MLFSKKNFLTNLHCAYVKTFPKQINKLRTIYKIRGFKSKKYRPFRCKKIFSLMKKQPRQKPRRLKNSNGNHSASDNLILYFISKFRTADCSYAFQRKFFSSTRSTASDDISIDNDPIFGKFAAQKFSFASRITCSLSIDENMSFAEYRRGGTNGKNPLVIVIEATNRIFDCSARLEVLHANTATRQEYAIEIGRFELVQGDIGLYFKPMKALHDIFPRNRSDRHLKTCSTPQIHRNDEFRFFKAISKQHNNLHITSK